jgi:predicted nucleic acid-binding Zn ribbon protein
VKGKDAPGEGRGNDGERRRDGGRAGRSASRAPDRGMGKVDEVLGGLLRKLGIEEELARQGAVERWAAVVGEGIAEVTRARAQAGGVLFVAVRSSAWLNELSFMRAELLRRMNAGAGDGRIERIVFQLAEDDLFDEP